MSDLKLCKDCKFCVPESSFWMRPVFGGKKYEFALCSKDLNPVDGKAKDDNWCSLEREFDFRCGPKANWFEPKNPKALPKSTPERKAE